LGWGGDASVAWLSESNAVPRPPQMWPPFSLLSFMALPMHWRPLAANVVGVCFIAILSLTRLSDEVLPLGEHTAELVEAWLRSVSQRARGSWRWAKKNIGEKA
jgi:hypothetical protein